jgi:hypothetical protein
MRVVLDEGDDEITVATFAVPKLSWDEWWASVEGRLDEMDVEAVAPVDDQLPVPRPDRTETSEAPSLTDDVWRR